MSKYLSDQNRTAFQYESGTAGYGLTSGNRQWIGQVQEHSNEPNMNVINVRYQGSTDRNKDTFADGVREWEGTMTYFPQDWKFLGYAIGSIQDLTGSHIFSENNSDDRVQSTNTPLTSFTIEDSKNLGNAGSNFIRTTIGAMINSFTINASVGEIVSVDIDYIAQDSTLSSGAIVALAATTTAPFVFNNVELFIPSGTAIDNATELTFNVNNNLSRGTYLNGSQIPAELLPMNRDYEVTATTLMDDGIARTLYEDYFVAGSTFNSLIKCWGTAGSLSIIMSGCKMNEMGVPSPMDGDQEQTFTFTPKTATITAYDSIVKYNAW